jgi:hypothetical protein
MPDAVGQFLKERWKELGIVWKRIGGRTMRYLLVIISAILLTLLVVGVGCVVTGKDVGAEIALPIIAITGVVVLLGVLAFVAIGFSMVNLHDRTEALGLPPGSVRGVIALSLVVLFAILSVFLFGALKDGAAVTIATCLKQEQRIELLTSLGNRPGVASVQSDQMDGGVLCPAAELAWAAAKEAQAAIAKASNAEKVSKALDAQTKTANAETVSRSLYKVYSRDPANQASTDFTKQLLVLIGTLVTAVASFYFGSKAVGEAQATMAGLSGPPSPFAVTPNPVTRDPKKGVWLSVTGSSLNDVKQLQLVLGDRRINGTEVVSSANKADAKFTIDDKVEDGPWDVVVADGSGRTARLAAALKVVDPTSSSTSPPTSPPRSPPVSSRRPGP